MRKKLSFVCVNLLLLIFSNGCYFCSEQLQKPLKNYELFDNINVVTVTGSESYETVSFSNDRIINLMLDSLSKTKNDMTGNLLAFKDLEIYKLFFVDSKTMKYFIVYVYLPDYSVFVFKDGKMIVNGKNKEFVEMYLKCTFIIDEEDENGNTIPSYKAQVYQKIKKQFNTK